MIEMKDVCVVVPCSSQFEALQALDRAQGHQIWASYQQLQSTYESGLQTVMHSLRHEKNRFNTHLVDLKTKFSK